MNFAEVFAYSTYIFIAASAAIACIVLGVFLLHVSQNRVQAFFPVMLFMMTLMGVSDAALSGRTLDRLSLSAEAAFESGTRLPSKIMLAFLIGLSLVVVVSQVLKRRPAVAMSQALFWGLMVFYITCAVAPAAFGYDPQFIVALVYTPFVLYGLFASIPRDPERVILYIKLSMAVIVGLSLVAAMVITPVVLESGYRGLIPGFNRRLWGLASHANVLGPVALTLLVLEWCEPMRSRIANFGMIGMALTAIALTQSKTTVLATGVAFATVFAYRTFVSLNGAMRPNAIARSDGNFRLVISIGVIFATISLFLAYLLLADQLPSRMDFLDRNAVQNMQTGSGRQPIWDLALNEGWRHPFFGYGLSIWGLEYRFSHALLSAFHAHNQVLQVFSLAGFTGVIGFAVYFVILVRASLKLAAISGGATLALLSILVIRSITEVPLQISALTSGDFLSHLAFAFYLVACSMRAATWPAIPVVEPKRPMLAGGNARYSNG